MVTSKNVAELKKRITKENCTFTRMCTAYVSYEGEILAKSESSFLNLPENEFTKYMALAKVLFNEKKIDENVFTLELDKKKDAPYYTELRTNLVAAVDTGLKDQEIVNDLFYQISSEYKRIGNYIIILWHDAYDVPVVTSDGIKNDESDEVYTYIACAICPVVMQDPGLSYNENDTKFESLNRKWMIKSPAAGFVYPAFDDRTADYDKIMYYDACKKRLDHELITEVLGCKDVLSATEYKNILENAVKLMTKDSEDSQFYLEEIHGELMNYVFSDEGRPNEEPTRVDTDLLNDILHESSISDGTIDDIIEHYEHRIGEMEWPKVEWLYNKKYAAKYLARLERSRIKRLLRESANIANAAGNMDIESEIREYLEKVR